MNEGFHRRMLVGAAIASAWIAFGPGLPAALGQTGAASKSVPAIARPPANATPQPTVASEDDRASQDARAEIQRKLAAAQAQLAALETGPESATTAPVDTPPSEIVNRLALTRQLTGVYQQQLEMLTRTEEVRAHRADAERALESWSGFSTPPPHSLPVIDGLRDDQENAEARIASAQSRRTLFERFGNEIAAKLKASQAAARLAAEAADRAGGTPGAARAAWQRDVARLQAQLDGATQELLQMGGRNAREEAATAEASLALARRKLSAAGHDFNLPPEDLARIYAEIDTRRRAGERDLDRAVRAAALAADARGTAEQRFSDARAATAGPEGDAAAALRLEALAEDLEVKREAATTATLRVDLLKQYLSLLGGERIAWEARADAMNVRDPVHTRAAYERITGSLATVHAWREYLAQQFAAARARVAEVETRLRTATGADTAQVQLLLDVYRQRESDLRRAMEQGEPLERVLRRFREDFQERREVSFGERARDAAAAALLALRRAWNFEVVAVEDSFETADGRKLSVERSVTVGKTVGAVLIVVVGYWLCSWIARRIERMVVKRGHVAPQSAALLRNWTLFVLTAILVIFALVSSSIPLTVFAFLGGALAIAAGFGMQTLLKNFVAGIMLLFEGPMRLGDLVEVDGFRGRVTAIGIRASTILSADGIETMIPNGTFIENKLTNWTYSSPQARQTLTIGVAYGTPLRKASDVMQEVLARHGLVLEEPAPQVYLDDYADSAIKFTLTYWVEMTPTNDTRRIKSDVLHMLDKALAEAGIRMPFPQRDVHVETATPLKVEVVAPSRPEGAVG